MNFTKENSQGPKVRRLLTRRDLGLFFFLVIMAAGGWLFQARLEPAREAVIHLFTGQSISVDLSTDQEFPIQGRLGPLTAVVAEGQIWISEAPCSDQICVSFGTLPDETMAIICVPSGVMIEAVRERTRYDAFSW